MEVEASVMMEKATDVRLVWSWAMGVVRDEQLGLYTTHNSSLEG